MNILVICTGNSARSILLESILNRRGAPDHRAYSAGSTPVGRVNPFAEALLLAKDYDLSDARSKSWDEFAAPDAPRLDLAITVCDSAAGETCPYFTGAPLIIHWGIPDPAAATGTDAKIAQAFSDTYEILDARAKALVELDPDTMAADDLRRAMAVIAEKHQP